MKADERRQALLKHLQAADAPVSGSALAASVGVSRQVIVQDIAVLRASGHQIVPTARGYQILSDARQSAEAPLTSQPQTSANTDSGLVTRVIKVHHTEDQTADELSTILANEGAILDVSVNHRAYGHITAPLNIYTRADVLDFLNKIATGKSTPLLNITSGYHYHTIAAKDEGTLNRIERALDAKGYLAPLLPHEQKQGS